METIIEINEAGQIKDYFPCLFANKDKSIIILANERTSDKTFSGMIIHVTGEKGKSSVLGKYESGWTYVQFSRLPKNSSITLTIKQND
jgi:hypothetical protein